MFAVQQRLQLLQQALHAPPASEGGFRLPSLGLNWHQHEQDCLRQALQLAQGNKAQAAKLLHLPYKTLLYRLEKYQLGS